MLGTVATRTVVITGGTGALGRANVGAFLASGHRVLVSWIVRAEYEEARRAWRDALAGGQLELVEADVADSEGASRVAKLAGDAVALVNGVGGFGGGAPVHETPLELWDHLYRLNVRSAAAMCHALVPGMLARRRGAIVNVASQAASSCPAGIAAYSASKAALVALTRSLQKEVASASVRVNAVAPSTIDTPANRAAMPDADFSSWTPPERIASAIHWLASDEASAVRGALIEV